VQSVGRGRCAAQVHKTVRACLHKALCSVPGGYMCREQEADLKYMVVFFEPQVRLLFIIKPY